MAKVRDAMTKQVLTITPGRTLRDAAQFMTEHNIGAVVVMDPEQPGPGIVTERDLVRSLGRGEDPGSETVADHLTSRAAFADCEWDLQEAADTMAEGADEVALGDDARAGLLRIHDDDRADVVLGHELRGVAQRPARRDRQHLLGHRVSHLRHACSSSTGSCCARH